MQFRYVTIDQEGNENEGTIEAINKDVAISSLQRRGLMIAEIESAESTSLLNMRLEMFERVSNKEIVILSRQISTLFQAQVSALKVFRLLGSEVENPKLRDALADIAQELQGGSSISSAMSNHDDVFSDFYVNMVKAGEESGNLDKTFAYLADYLDRNYELTSKAKNALIYPSFVIFTFIAVMVLMLTTVIPNITTIIEESGQAIPIYTQIVISLSDFFVNYGILIAVGLIVGAYFFYQYAKTKDGQRFVSRLKLSVPYLGDLYQKLYLSRLADNMNTMLVSGIPMTRAIEITASVVDNKIYEDLLLEVVEEVRGGRSVSDALGDYDEIPSIMIQMISIGEETGELGSILETLSDFYRREVITAVDTLVDLIEPVMIVALGLGVGTLLAAVLMPIYNISGSI